MKIGLATTGMCDGQGQEDPPSDDRAPESQPQNCPLCHSEQTEPLYCLPGLSDTEVALHQCASCGLAFLVECPPENAYEDEYYFFRPWMAHLHQLLASRRWQEIAGAVEGSRLIDVGCGQGGILGAALSAGMSARGIEPNPQAAAGAREATGAQVRVGKAGQAEELQGWADTVVTFDVIEHVRDPSEFLRDLRRLMRPGALAIVETPHFGQFSRKLMGKNWYALNPYHVSMMDERSMRHAAEKSGFKILRFETPHIGLSHVVCRLVYEVGLRSFLKVVLLNDRSDVYESHDRPPRGILRKLIGNVVFRRDPLNRLIQAIGMGDKLRAYLRGP